MERTQSIRQKAIRLILRFYLAICTCGIILPTLWTILTSFKSTSEFLVNPFGLPEVFYPENYINAWKMAKIGNYFFSSMCISAIVCIVVVILGSMTAYACTRLRIRAGGLVIACYMLGVFIPVELCIVPIFLQLRGLHLLDTHLGLVLLYIAIRLPFTVFILAGNFKTLPHELEEAAIIDGCSYNQVFWKVMMPLAKPGLATVTIFNFLSIWNEYVLAKTIMLTPDKVTLPVGLISLQAATRHQCDYGALFAGMVIVMIPTLIVYMFFQKQLTSGITAGAVKG